MDTQASSRITNRITLAFVAFECETENNLSFQTAGVLAMEER